MLTLDFGQMQQQVDKVAAMGTKIRPAPVFFYPYLERVLKMDWEVNKPEFPMTIRIAKPNSALMKGDFEPLQEIILEEPVTLDNGTPMWLNRSDEKVLLRFGYENMDARKISSFELSMDYIHWFLGGASGHGKSVTLNSVLGSMFYEYPPWEVEVHMSDAKIIEFKKYGVGHRIPHISTIAATEDPDFVISVLDKAYTEMNERAKIFGNIGASNLKSFRKQTKLALPRVVIVMDEVESTFKMAGKKASKIAFYIDGFARLGRAAGYHLFLATQNMSSDIPSSAIGQIRGRCCLGANEKTSTSVLGNSGATANYGCIGRLIVNTEVMNGGNTVPFNVKFQTPYINDDEFADEMPFLESKGKAVGFNKVMAFYDEEDMRTCEQFDKTIDAAMQRMKAEGEVNKDTLSICLGFPAFVCDDKDELLKIKLDHRDVENILIACTSVAHTSAHLHNISKCLGDCGYVVQLFTTDSEQKDWVYKPAVSLEARSAEQPPLNSIANLVRKRLFLMQVDSSVASVQYDRAKVEEVLRKDGVPAEACGNDLLCKRVVVANNLLGTKDWEDVKYLFKTSKEIYAEYEKCHCSVKTVEASDFAQAAFIVGDLAKIVGYGRDNKSKCVNVLKKAMQDANRVGVLYVLFSRSLEGLTDLVSGLRYTIFDSPDGRDWGRLRTEEPGTLGSRLACLYDSADSDNPHKKFKRTLLREE